MSGRISATIDVRRSAEAVYQQLTQFESLPQFMEGVVEVQQLDDTHLFWRINVGSATRGFYVAITEQRADERVAWRSDDGGPAHSGVVTVHGIDAGTTRVTVQMSVARGRFAENEAGELSVLDRRVRHGLDRFQQFIEK